MNRIRGWLLVPWAISLSLSILVPTSAQDGESREQDTAKRAEITSEIRDLFAKLSEAARKNDKNALLPFFIPSLRKECEEGVEREVLVNGNKVQIREVFEVWRDELARNDIRNLNEPFEVVVLKWHLFEDTRLLEVGIRFNSARFRWTHLWCFQVTPDGLLLADWPFGGSPSRSVKHFDLSRPEEPW